MVGISKRMIPQGVDSPLGHTLGALVVFWGDMGIPRCAHQSVDAKVGVKHVY